MGKAHSRKPARVRQCADKTRAGSPQMRTDRPQSGKRGMKAQIHQAIARINDGGTVVAVKPHGAFRGNCGFRTGTGGGAAAGAGTGRFWLLTAFTMTPSAILPMMPLAMSSLR